MDIINVFLESKKINGEDFRLMICPTSTTHLTDEKILNNPKLIVLKKAYDSIVELEPEYRVLLSLLNSLITNNLLVFCASRRSLEKIVMSDKNIQNPTFVSTSYNKYLKKMYDVGIKRLAPSQVNKKKSGIYYLSEMSPFRGLFDSNSDFEIQLEAALAFSVPQWKDIDDKILLKKYEQYFSSGSYDSKIASKPSTNLVPNLVLDQKRKKEIKENTIPDFDIDFDNCSIDEMFLVH